MKNDIDKLVRGGQQTYESALIVVTCLAIGSGIGIVATIIANLIK